MEEGCLSVVQVDVYMCEETFNSNVIIIWGDGFRILVPDIIEVGTYWQCREIPVIFVEGGKLRRIAVENTFGLISIERSPWCSDVWCTTCDIFGAGNELYDIFISLR